MISKRVVIRLTVLFSMAALLVSCGQSGKLVMPGGKKESPLAKQAQIAGEPITWVDTST